MLPPPPPPRYELLEAEMFLTAGQVFKRRSELSPKARDPHPHPHPHPDANPDASPDANPNHNPNPNPSPDPNS